MAESPANGDKTRRPWPFRKRWRIEGCLFTLSPLHIGTGEITSHPDLKNGDEPVEINACAKDYLGKPMIPGSSLKGSCRQWLKRHGFPAKLIENVFGREAEGKDEASGGDATGSNIVPSADDAVREEGQKEDSGSGGKAEFHDARLTITRTGDTPLPHWREDRHTYVEVSNCIDRPTRTVAENKLFHLETVPAGVGFHVKITGLLDSEDEVKLLLAALEGFNRGEDPATLGADTASGKGRCRWELSRICCMDKAKALEWVRRSQRGMAEDAMPEITTSKLRELLDGAERLASPVTRDSLVLKVKILFAGLFLVNDPPTEREKKVALEARPPDARPRTDEMGRVILPAKSFRGALRSQAEKIIRTLGGYACNPGDGNRACREIHTIAEAKKFRTAEEEPGLCLACQLFGAPGWKTPLEISDFTPMEGTGEVMTQEFIAIDRFTGGGKKTAKFNARAVYRPVFKGRLELDQHRARMLDDSRNGKGDWEVGLLALVLRDLVEGDITFGYGASKGYGTCTANVARIRWPNKRKFKNDAAIKNGLEAFRQKIGETRPTESVQPSRKGGGA